MSDTPPPPSLPAGWYPDPNEVAGQRYWDGNAWTGARAAAPPPPQSEAAQGPEKKQSKWRSIPKWRWIAGGLLVILALWPELGGSGNDKQSMTAEKPATSMSAPDNSGLPTLASAPEAQIDQEVQDGTFAFTVTDVEMTKTIGDGTLQKTSQGTYVVFSMNVKNVGDTPQSFNGGNQTLLDTAGQEYAVDGGADYNLNTDVPAGLGAEINPGDQISVKIAFDLPPGAHPSALKLHDSKFSGGAVVRLP